MTPQLQAAIYDGHCKGMDHVALAERFDTRLADIPRLIGIERRLRIAAALSAGEDPRAIADRFDVSLARVRAIDNSETRKFHQAVERRLKIAEKRASRPKKPRKPKPAEIKEKALQLARLGLKYRAIADRLQIDPRKCYRMLDRERRRAMTQDPT